MSVLLLIFGIFSGCFLAVLVGFLGRERNIGFGWAFVLSVLFTPLVGLLITLLSDKRYDVEPRSWGCLGSVMAILGAAIVWFFMLLFAGFV